MNGDEADALAGEPSVRHARRSLEAALAPGASGGPPSAHDPSLDRARGAFVSLRTFPARRLRGCVGIPFPGQPLRVVLAECALAASRDDRFPPVAAGDLASVVVEVSLLSRPRLLDGAFRGAPSAHLVPGRDGVLVDRDGRRGLLLPQVALERGWSAEEFLAAACRKAGLEPNAWRSPAARVRAFTSLAFEEESPGGRVLRVA